MCDRRNIPNLQSTITVCAWACMYVCARKGAQTDPRDTVPKAKGRGRAEAPGAAPQTEGATGVPAAPAPAAGDSACRQVCLSQRGASLHFHTLSFEPE